MKRLLIEGQTNAFPALTKKPVLFQKVKVVNICPEQ